MKIQNENDLDIVKLILLIWSYKSKFLLITILFFLLSVLHQFYFNKDNNSSEKIKLATTEIKAITTFEELKYVSYNSYINRYQRKNNFFYKFNKKIDKKILYEDTYTFKKFNGIDKDYLFNLFLEKLSDDVTIINLIKKFDLIKKDNYLNNIDYEEAVIKFASTFN